MWDSHDASVYVHVRCSNADFSLAAGQQPDRNHRSYGTHDAKVTGTIAGVTAGTGLTGGGITGSVTLNLDTTKIPQLNVPNTFGAIKR